MRIWIVWSKNIEPFRNKAFYKRIEYLTSRHETHLLTRSHTEIDSLLADRLIIERSPHYQLPLAFVFPGKLRRNLADYGDLLTFYQWVIQRLNNDPDIRTNDIVYTFQNLDAHAGYCAALRGYTWIVDVLDMPDLYLEAANRFAENGRRLTATWMRFFFHRILKLDKAFRFAQQVLVTAPALDKGFAKRMVEEYGVPVERVVLTTNGVDLTRCRPEGRPWPEKMNKGFVVFYVGLLAPERGTTLLVEVMARLAASCPRLSLVLAGGSAPGYIETLCQYVKSLELGDRVHILGNIPHEQVLAWIENSQVCVYPFLHTEVLDGVFPIKLLEYLAMGRACVASDLTGARVIIEDGVNGLLVPTGDVTAWVTAIQRLYRDDKLRRSLELRARPSVLKFDWEAVNDRIYTHILEYLGDRIPN